MIVVLMKLLESDSCRRARVCELAHSVKDLQQLDLDGFVVCWRLSATDDIVVMAFSFLGKLLLMVAACGSVSFAQYCENNKGTNLVSSVSGGAMVL